MKLTIWPFRASPKEREIHMATWPDGVFNSGKPACGAEPNDRTWLTLDTLQITCVECQARYGIPGARRNRRV